MVYGRIGTGYRSGGFNTRAAATGNFPVRAGKGDGL
jgi:iron complex outermembrane receptor protein